MPRETDDSNKQRDRSWKGADTQKSDSPRVGELEKTSENLRFQEATRWDPKQVLSDLRKEP